MKTERIILAMVLLMFPVIAFCQYAVTPHKSQLVLKDQTVVDGYLRSMLSNVDTVILFSEKPNGKKKRYGASNIDRLKVLEYDSKYYNSSPHADQMDANLVGTWVPMYINNEIGKIGQVWRNQALLMEIYKGNHICGYIGWDYFHGYRCYYKLPDKWYAKAFCPLKKMNKHRKELLLQEFTSYPELTTKISSGAISDNTITENPFVLLWELDKILTAENETNKRD